MPGKRPTPTPLAEAFERAVDALGETRAAYALIGGFAVAHHGLPRPTRDVDLLLHVPRVALPALLEAFRDRGFELDLERVLRELRDDRLSEIRYRGVRVDLLDAVLPVFVRAVERAESVEIAGRPVRVVRPEDLIELKMIAGREDDLRDVKGILAAQGDRLDLDGIRANLRAWCAPGTIEAFERIVTDAR